ncbi:MAG: CoA pyrophosphatase [Bacteroidetes bacterium]|nr:CoA pyrophosphatase [Bacteroidota bacterium]
MKFDKIFIEKLKQELQKPLPGEEAQYRMAPSYRPRLTKEEILANNPRLSGVMLLLFEKKNELHIAFTQRKKYEGVHSGQMSFPGGKKDISDADLLETALRETFEEIGIDRNKIEVIGGLSELYIPPSNFLVSPSIGFATGFEKFVPPQNEVEKVVEIPVSFFFDNKNVNLRTEIKLFDGSTVHVPAYIFNEHIIWGATAIMLSEFVFISERITVF